MLYSIRVVVVLFVVVLVAVVFWGDLENEALALYYYGGLRKHAEFDCGFGRKLSWSEMTIDVGDDSSAAVSEVGLCVGQRIIHQRYSVELHLFSGFAVAVDLVQCTHCSAMSKCDYLVEIAMFRYLHQCSRLSTEVRCFWVCTF